MMLPTEQATKTFQKYLKRSPRTGKIAETIEQSFERVAACIAEQDERPLEFYDELLSAMTNLELLPNRPAWFGAGTRMGMLSACTMVFIQDSLVRGKGSILGSLQDVAAIQQAGSGVGQYWGALRPAGSVISRSGGEATGPIGFLLGYNEFLRTIQQGGFLHGANNAAFPVHHPQAFEFAELKLDDETLDQYNTNFYLTEFYLNAVRNDGDFTLCFEQQQEKTIRARDLFDKITFAMWRNGGLGVQFIDPIRRANAIPGLGNGLVSNPCGEFFGFDGESCCPAYINMAKLSESGMIDWDRLAYLSRLATRMNDNLIDANRYVAEVPKLERMAKYTRRMGNGPNGLADMFINLGVIYGSDESIAIAGQVMEHILFYSIKESIELAKTRGPFPAITQSIYNPGVFKFKKPVPFFRGVLDCPPLDWWALIQEMQHHGVRNCGFTTIAPSSFGAQTMCTNGYGWEPIYDTSYTRMGEQYTVAPNEVLKTAYQVDPFDKLRMQAALQRFTTEGIANTVNLPNDATQELIGQIIFEAERLQLKGVTAYRTGSRGKEVLCPSCQIVREQ